MSDEILGKSSFDISYFETFRKALWDITDKDELIASVPNSRFHGYIELLDYLLEYASEEINDIMEDNKLENRQIESLIYEIRGMKVMLDRDLAKLYGVETKVLNQAVKEI